MILAGNGRMWRHHRKSEVGDFVADHEEADTGNALHSAHYQH